MAIDVTVSRYRYFNDRHTYEDLRTHSESLVTHVAQVY
jgi:hypothetical protein